MLTLNEFRRALTANHTAATAFSTKLPVAALPTSLGFFSGIDHRLATAGVKGYGPRRIMVVPFGTDAANETFDMRIWGWSKVTGADLYIPHLIADLAITLGAVAATPVGALHLLADTIVVTKAEPNIIVSSPANDTPGFALVHLHGAQHVEFEFKVGTAAAANCYWRTVDDQ